MLTHDSLEQLRALRLEGLARAFEEQLAHPGIAALAFDERLAQLIDREVLLRDGKRIERLLKAARIKVGGACLEDVDYRRGTQARPQGRVDEKKGNDMRPCARYGLPTGARPPAHEARWRPHVDKPVPNLETTVIVTDAVKL